MDMAADVDARLPIRSDLDLAWVRQHVRQAATRVGFGLVDQTKLVTAASELARNTLVHGGGGVLETTRVTAADGTAGLRLTFSDQGPGIPDLERALSDGYTSGDGLGMGLGGSRRLVHDFEVDSAPGSGTVVRVTSWVSRPVGPRGGL